jgi:hypothetical protein
MFLGILVFCLFCLNCSDRSTEPEISAYFNNPTPANMADDVSLDLVLTWETSLNDESEIEFYVSIGTIPDPTQANQPQHSYTPGGLLPGQTYYWRVEGHTPHGHIYRSPIWRFRTAGSFKYPLKVGNAWDYQVSTFYTDIELHDSLIQPLYEENYRSMIVVDSFGVLPENDKPAFRLTESLYGEIIYPTDMHNWFNNEPDGLYHYAYDGGGGGSAIPRKITPGSVKAADSRIAAIMGMSPTPFARPMLSGEYTFEPVRSLAYPMRVGNQWVFMEDGPLGTIQKRVIDLQRVKIGDQMLFCWVVKWLYDQNSLDIADDIDLIDYYSTDGLVKRSVTIRDVAYVTYDQQFAARATWHQEIVLDSMYQVLVDRQ